MTPVPITPALSRRRTPRGLVVHWADGLVTRRQGNRDEVVGVWPVMRQTEFQWEDCRPEHNRDGFLHATGDERDVMAACERAGLLDTRNQRQRKDRIK